MVEEKDFTVDMRESTARGIWTNKTLLWKALQDMEKLGWDLTGNSTLLAAYHGAEWGHVGCWWRPETNISAWLWTLWADIPNAYRMYLLLP